MAKLVKDYTNYIPPSTTQTLKSGAGKVHAIFSTANTTTPVTVILYDNTAGSGNILYAFNVASPQPFILILPPILALKFSTGLTVVTPATAVCYIVTEESET